MARNAETGVSRSALTDLATGISVAPTRAKRENSWKSGRSRINDFCISKSLIIERGAQEHALPDSADDGAFGRAGAVEIAVAAELSWRILAQLSRTSPRFTGPAVRSGRTYWLRRANQSRQACSRTYWLAQDVRNANQVLGSTGIYSHTSA